LETADDLTPPTWIHFLLDKDRERGRVGEKTRETGEGKPGGLEGHDSEVKGHLALGCLMLGVRGCLQVSRTLTARLSCLMVEWGVCCKALGSG